MSIYSNVSSYLPSPNRNPKEDFLTAALADLLNRLPAPEHITFIADVLLQGEAAGRWRAYLATTAHTDLSWKTQQSVSHHGKAGRPDLILYVNGRAAIVVEVKINAAYTSHVASDVVAEVEHQRDDASPAVSERVATQLVTYGGWLDGQCRGGSWAGALVLLTHSREPPDDFGSARYGVTQTSVCRWRHIWRWAESVGKSTAEFDGEVSIWRQLAFEFATFLGDEGMSADGLMLGDLDGLASLSRLHGRAEKTFAIVAERLMALPKELAAGKPVRFEFTEKMSTLWTWLFLSKPKGGRWYIGYGLRFPRPGTFWSAFEPPLPSQPHAFVMVGRESSIPMHLDQVEAGDLSRGWTRTGPNEMVIGQMVSEFRKDADGFTDDLARWIEKEICAISPTLIRLAALAENKKTCG